MVTSRRWLTTCCDSAFKVSLRMVSSWNDSIDGSLGKTCANLGRYFLFRLDDLVILPSDMLDDRVTELIETRYDGGCCSRYGGR